MGRFGRSRPLLFGLALKEGLHIYVETYARVQVPCWLLYFPLVQRLLGLAVVAAVASAAAATPYAVASDATAASSQYFIQASDLGRAFVPEPMPSLRPVGLAFTLEKPLLPLVIQGLQIWRSQRPTASSNIKSTPSKKQGDELVPSPMSGKMRPPSTSLFVAF